MTNDIGRVVWLYEDVVSRFGHIQLKQIHARFIVQTTSTWLLLQAELHLFRNQYNVSYWDREPRLSIYFVLNNVFRRQEPLSLDTVVAATSGTWRCHDGCSRQRESDTWYTFTAKSGWDGSHRDACYTASERSSGVRRKLHRDSDRYTAYGYGAKYIFPSKNCKSPTSSRKRWITHFKKGKRN